MILLLGADTYIGQAFARALRRRKGCFIPLSREALDFSRFEVLFDYVRKIKPELVINAAGCAEPWNKRVADFDRLGMLEANTLLPQTVARVCAMTNSALGHVSSGGIYTGARVLVDGALRIETDLSRPDLCGLFEHQPRCFSGFTELDPPNVSFRSAPCTFAGGTTALAEEAMREQPNCFIWRFRLPFNEQDHPDNFLCSLPAAASWPDTIHSLSQVDDCASACLELWEHSSPFGTYNVVNAGALRVRELLSIGLKTANATLSALAADAGAQAAALPPAGCILEAIKLRKAGIIMRPLHQAWSEALARWKPRQQSVAPHPPQLRVLASP